MSRTENMLEFAHAMAKIPGLKRLLKPWYYRYKERQRTDSSEEFRGKALNVLKEFDEVMTNNGFHYTLTFGSMLGAVREKGFIKHDLDIDVALWADEYSHRLTDVLEGVGFKLAHYFLVDDGTCGREETYEKDGVGIDVFYYHPPIDRLPYCSSFRMMPDTATFRSSMKKYGCVVARRVGLPVTRERKRVPFESIEVYIPQNAEEILAFYYGADYMTPQKGWTEAPMRDVVVWEDRKGYYFTL